MRRQFQRLGIAVSFKHADPTNTSSVTGADTAPDPACDLLPDGCPDTDADHGPERCPYSVPHGRSHCADPESHACSLDAANCLPYLCADSGADGQSDGKRRHGHSNAGADGHRRRRRLWHVLVGVGGLVDHHDDHHDDHHHYDKHQQRQRQRQRQRQC